MSKWWQRVGEVVIYGILIDVACYFVCWIWERNSSKSSVRPCNEVNTETNSDMKRMTLMSCGKSNEFFHRVIFFPEERVPCRFYYEAKKNGYGGCCRKNCTNSHEAPLLEYLLDLLHSAQNTLDVCVYLISCSELCTAILHVHSRGKKVRIITDGNFSDDSKSKIGTFRAKGIPVRCHKSGFLMHHKFAIVDSRILTNGSFNWTWQAVTGNHENLLTTDNVAVVQPYVEEFSRLWNLFALDGQ